MSTDQTTPTTVIPPVPAIVPDVELNNGDRMDREEFHRLYEKTPEDFKAELIGGVVYVASPVKRPHGKSHMLLCAALAAYESKTPGVDCGDNVTVLLANDAQPQPDIYARILPEFGGQSKTANDFLDGAPELAIEIALSSRAIDLHAKKDDYARYGVNEYLVVSVRDRKIFWFDLSADKELTPDANDVYRIGVFPGLWIKGSAVLALDYTQLMATLNEGLATPEHAAFVKQLEAQRK